MTGPCGWRIRHTPLHHGAAWRRLALVALAAILLCHPVRAAERVVSLNLCTDQTLVLLAPEKVAALSPLARDPTLSYVAAQAARLPVVRASAEAVLRLHPDLVLATRYGARTTLALLEQEGLTVVRATLPQDFPSIRRETIRLAALLGVPQRGAALVAAMDATLAGIPAPSRPRTALAWQPRGYTAGPGSLMDAVMRAAGLDNLSAGQRLGVEALLRHPPDLLVVAEAPAFPSLATAALHQTALASIPRLSLPPALTLCAGPFTARAVALLAR